MKRTRLLDGVLWGVSALIGLVVAEGVYKASKNTIEKRELIGDGEVVSDEVMENDVLDEEDLPF